MLTTRFTPASSTQPAGQLMMRAGIDLLPPRAQEMLSLTLTPGSGSRPALAVQGVSPGCFAHRYATAPIIVRCAEWP